MFHNYSTPLQGVREQLTLNRLTYGLKPYHLQLVQELKPPDWLRRLNFCQWLLNFSRNNIAVFNQMFFTNEAWFHLHGFVNTQNYHI